MTTTYSTIAELIGARQTAQGLSDADLAAALGYETERVVAMIKTDQMHLPLNKVVDLAEALAVDARVVLRLAMKRSSSDLFEVIERVLDPLSLMPHEVNLIRHLRARCGTEKVVPVVMDGNAVIAIVRA